MTSPVSSVWTLFSLICTWLSKSQLNTSCSRAVASPSRTAIPIPSPCPPNLAKCFFFFSFTRRAILGKNHWNCWKIIYRQSSLYTGSVQGFNQPRIWIPWIPRANCTTTFCKRYPWILVSAGILESIPWEYRGPIIMPKKKNQALLLIIWMCTKMPRKHLISLVRLVTYFSM